MSGRWNAFVAVAFFALMLLSTAADGIDRAEEARIIRNRKQAEHVRIVLEDA